MVETSGEGCLYGLHLLANVFILMPSRWIVNGKQWQADKKM
jgi:hypothetical protein